MCNHKINMYKLTGCNPFPTVCVILFYFIVCLHVIKMYFSKNWLAYLKIHMENQGTQDSQNMLEKEKQSCGTHLPITKLSTKLH